jgi:hypothetical protein
MKSNQTRLYHISFASVYPLYIAKVKRKGQSIEGVDEIIHWLTGYDAKSLKDVIDQEMSFESFIHNAPHLNPLRYLVKGVICGVRIEDIEEDTMREIRILDKLIDELANGKSMDKILRKPIQSK